MVFEDAAAVKRRYPVDPAKFGEAEPGAVDSHDKENRCAYMLLRESVMASCQEQIPTIPCDYS